MAIRRWTLSLTLMALAALPQYAQSRPVLGESSTRPATQVVALRWNRVSPPGNNWKWTVFVGGHGQEQGTAVPYQVPKGHILVVTAVTWGYQCQQDHAGAAFRFNLTSGTAPSSGFECLSTPTLELKPGTRRVRQQETYPTGIAFPSQYFLSISPVGGLEGAAGLEMEVWLHGYYQVESL